MSFILLIPVTEGFIPCETTSASCVIQLRLLCPCRVQSYDVCSDHEIYTFGLGVLYTVSVKIKTLNVLDEIKVQLKSMVLFTTGCRPIAGFRLSLLTTLHVSMKH